MRALTLPWELLGQLAQAAEAVGSQLAQDAWQHLCQLLGLGVARDGEGVGRERRLHFGVVEVDHCPIVFYHVHLQTETKVCISLLMQHFIFLRASEGKTHYLSLDSLFGQKNLPKLNLKWVENIVENQVSPLCA